LPTSVKTWAKGSRGAGARIESRACVMVKRLPIFLQAVLSWFLRRPAPWGVWFRFSGGLSFGREPDDPRAGERERSYGDAAGETTPGSD